VEPDIGQFVLVAVVAFFAATVAAISGYGTGLVLPLVLVPVIGAEATVPVLGVSAFFVNAGRLAAFWRYFDRRHAVIITAAALPTCLLGAYSYTLLSGRGASLVIGIGLLLLVPGRRLLARLHGRLPERWLAAAGAGFGFCAGTTPGSGVILISILLAAGLNGTAVIATDAGITILLALAKTVVFQASGALSRTAWLMALTIGVVALPGAFLARWIIPKIPPGVHLYILDGVVLVGAVLLIERGLS
jgi:uncharacterized membrane protein YfcA